MFRFILFWFSNLFNIFFFILNFDHQNFYEKKNQNKNILKFRMQNSLTSMHSATLTPMHLRKAKLMFFWVRYPSSQVLKMYFPDIKFNKNNTAQLVKWFSNFRWVHEFHFYSIFQIVNDCKLNLVNDFNGLY